MYQALYRKWRPQSFEDVVGQKHITQTLKNQVASSRVSHAYLFTGTRGTGKTTCAKLLARAVNCEHPVDGNPCNKCPSCRGILDGSILDILELDAASNTGVDNMRSILEETVYPPANVKKRVYIIDEVHMLSAGAFNALLKTLEEPPEYVMFILATTELDRVAATVQSRCQRFDFKRIPQLELAANLSRICEAEGITIEPDALEMLARLADGSARDSLSLLERCISQNRERHIERETVISSLGISPFDSLDELAQAVAAMDTAKALDVLDKLYMDGRELRSVFSSAALYFRDILLLLTAPEAAKTLISPENDTPAIRKTAALFNPRRVLDIISVLQKTIDALPRSSAGKLESEMCLIKLCTPQLMYASDPDMTGRMAALEARVSQASVSPAPAKNESAPKKAPVEKTTAEVSPSLAPADSDAPPPFSDDDVPPWDDSAFGFDAPPPAAEAPVKAAAPAANKAPEKAKSAKPAEEKKKSSSSLPELEPERKKALIDSVKPLLTRSVSTYLILSKLYFAGGELIVSVEGDIAKMILDKQDVKATLASAAEKQWGEAVRVRVCVGDPSVKNEAPELSGFDNIIASGREAGIKIDFI